MAVLGWRTARFLLRPSPSPKTLQLAEGVLYSRKVETDPVPNVIHVVEVDLAISGMRFVVTPRDESSRWDTLARTTSEWVEETGVLVGVNGSPFEPFHAKHALDYYPKSGDPVDVQGFSASGGNVYSEGHPDLPVLYWVGDRPGLGFSVPGDVEWALSGKQILMTEGRIDIVPVKSTDDELHPRTMVAYSKSGTNWWLVVVDGRQDDYSEGMSVGQLAELAESLGAWNAIGLDGGGSSTMAARVNGKVKVLNAPFHTRIPVRERPVANHLGLLLGSD